MVDYSRRINKIVKNAANAALDAGTAVLPLLKNGCDVIREGKKPEKANPGQAEV